MKCSEMSILHHLPLFAVSFACLDRFPFNGDVVHIALVVIYAIGKIHYFNTPIAKYKILCFLDGESFLGIMPTCFLPAKLNVPVAMLTLPVSKNATPLIYSIAAYTPE